MNTCRAAIYSVVTSVAYMGLAFGQTQAPQARTSNGGNPTAASTPASQAGKREAKETMKGCIVREQADHTGMSMAEAKKACQEQLRVSPPKQ
jgi:hypothetical protein